MWIAGLRGAMAYALAMESNHNPMFKHADGTNAGGVMLLITLLYSLFTILGISSVLNPVMVNCEVTRDKNEVVEERTDTEKELIDNIESNTLKKNCCWRMKKKIGSFDKYYFSPLFIKDCHLIKKSEQISSEDEGDWVKIGSKKDINQKQEKKVEVKKEK